VPFGVVLLLINVGLIVHAAKTGRFWPWGYIILFIPGFGALAYVLVELMPEWFGSVQGQKARRQRGQYARSFQTLPRARRAA
jgi:hypothetical protein